ncbi:MAG TPA: hypothetical protein VGV14_08475 [Rhodanobacter sp.]|nr:hypothetical protein [Rhodanobacter sp.]
MRYTFVSLALAVAFFGGPPVASGTDIPRVFAPGNISSVNSDFAPAFSPTSPSMLFTRSNGSQRFTILESKRKEMSWSAPTAAPYSGTWHDIEAAYAPNGGYVVFVSDRPSTEKGKPIHANYFGQDQIGGNLWRVDVSANGWGKPYRLPPTINRSNSVWTPSIAKNNDLFFMATDPTTGRFRLHRATSKHDGSYKNSQNVGFSNGQSNDVDPFVDPLERFVIFSSDRNAASHGALPGPERLFIAFDPLGNHPLVCALALPGWSDPKTSEVESRMSLDLRTLYFASRKLAHPMGSAPLGDWDNGKTNIWMVRFGPELWQKAAGASRACIARVLSNPG